MAVVNGGSCARRGVYMSSRLFFHANTPIIQLGSTSVYFKHGSHHQSPRPKHEMFTFCCAMPRYVSCCRLLSLLFLLHHTSPPPPPPPPPHLASSSPHQQHSSCRLFLLPTIFSRKICRVVTRGVENKRFCFIAGNRKDKKNEKKDEEKKLLKN